MTQAVRLSIALLFCLTADVLIAHPHPSTWKSDLLVILILLIITALMIWGTTKDRT